eukprot:TRINITY_DN61998_c0_g1_i1.p1 TRINITY_DN61998_c0_g1~~TRINITY_DN61998_c0_g1_i1.p1  ORF type:complete len:191 (+),score=44.15 TRINITY_DN61998_c0_g1_i1:130-702(+)
MKKGASVFLKQVVSLLGSLAKAKSLALKGKTNATKARLVLLGFLRNKKLLLPSISHKIHALLGHESHDKGEGNSSDHGDQNKGILIYNAVANDAPSDPCFTLPVMDGDAVDDDDKYPDLTHSLFDELEFDNGSESVIDLVRNSREDGSDFNLEEEIDHVADVFIRRFHKQMKMQKLDSFKRYLDMLDRSV